MKIAILGKQNPQHLRIWMKEQLEKAGHEAELRDMQTRTFLDFADQFLDYDALITCGEKLPTAAMETLAKGKVKLISRWGVGTDEMDKVTATKNGIAICNAAGSLSTAVAECALGLMINLLREFPARDASVRNNDWSWFFEGRVSRQLEGKTVGLIGFGDISKALAKMLVGFDCRVLACGSKRGFDSVTAEKYGVIQADIPTMQREADIISLHCPASEETINMVDKEFLQNMKQDAILINTGRGSLIVEEDLAWALQNGIIAAAGLDVFRQEPPQPDNPLLKLPNVMLLPHAGAGSIECLEKSSALAVGNIIEFFAGRPIPTILNKDYIQYVK